MAQATYDPEIWLESVTRVIKDYVTNAMNDDVYEVMMQFPGPMLDARTIPLHKTIVHFEIDDIIEHLVGFGDNYFAMNYNSTDETVNPQEAVQHQINFDVGVWASDASGGTTARLRARQRLSLLFGGAHSIQALRAASDGGNGCVEILRFSGGRFVIDKVNDLPLFRLVDCQLEVRVFSRTPLSGTPLPAIEEISQQPNLTVG